MTTLTKKIVLITLLFIVPTTIFAQKINQKNKQGLRIGVWKKYHKNGKLRYIGQFKNGKEIGTFKFYDNHYDTPQITKEYIPNSDVAIVKFYNSSGKLKTQGKMIGKKRDGKWTYFYPNGRLFSKEFYKNGKLEGTMQNFYPNGKLTNTVQYKNGKKEGLTKTYTDDGILIEEVMYTNGILNGLAKYYDLKGLLKEKGLYKNGKKEGKWEFYIDGEIAEKPKSDLQKKTRR